MEISVFIIKFPDSIFLLLFLERLALSNRQILFLDLALIFPFPSSSGDQWLGKAEERAVLVAEQQELQHISWINYKFQVKEGIVKCIDLYMSKNRAVVFLYLERDIEPRITELVWDELDKQNPEFFRAYKVNLALIKRIARFNNSLESHKTVTFAPHANGTSSTSKGPTGMEQPPTSAGMNHAKPQL